MSHSDPGGRANPSHFNQYSKEGKTMKRFTAIAFAAATATLAIGATTPPSARTAPPREINVTNDPTYGWGEQQIVVNPRNPNNIAIGTVGITLCVNDPRPDCKQVPATFDPPVPGLPPTFRGNRALGFYENPDFTAMYVYYSFDRGRTWARSRVPAHPVGLPRLTSQGDPSIAVGPDGTFYASWDANDWGTPERTLPAAGVAISMSKDGGKTWSPPVLTGTPVDAPKLVVDQQTGAIYGASSTFRGARSTGNPKDGLDPVNDRWVAMSRDGVKWSEPRGMGGFGSQMTAAHGLFATAFNTTATGSPFSSANNALCGTAPTPCTVFQTTADAGRTWSRHLLPTRLSPAAGMAGPGGTPMVAADPTRRGRFSVGVPMNGDSEFHIYTTADSGRTWSKPTVLTQDGSRSHYFAVMAYSPTGVLGVAWHTRTGPMGQPRTSATGASRPGPSPFSIWAAVSRNKGATFSRPIQVSTADSPAGSSSGDDYSGIAIDRDYLYVTWADWRPGTRQNFMAGLPLSDFK